MRNLSETTEKVRESNVGAFTGWASVNDWSENGGIMHCCTGNGTRAIYYVWENMLQHEGSKDTARDLIRQAQEQAFSWKGVRMWLRSLVG